MKKQPETKPSMPRYNHQTGYRRGYAGGRFTFMKRTPTGRYIRYADHVAAMRDAMEAAGAVDAVDTLRTMAVNGHIPRKIRADFMRAVETLDTLISREA